MSTPSLRLIQRGRPRRLSGVEVQAMTRDRVAEYLLRRRDEYVDSHSKHRTIDVPSTSGAAVRLAVAGSLRTRTKARRPTTVVPLVLGLLVFLGSSAAAIYCALVPDPRSVPVELSLALGLLLALSATAVAVLAFKAAEAMGDEPEGRVRPGWRTR